MVSFPYVVVQTDTLRLVEIASGYRSRALVLERKGVDVLGSPAWTRVDSWALPGTHLDGVMLGEILLTSPPEVTALMVMLQEIAKLRGDD